MKNDTSGEVWKVIKNINAAFIGLLLIILVFSIVNFLNTFDWSMLIFVGGIPAFLIAWTAITSIAAKAF